MLVSCTWAFYVSIMGHGKTLTISSDHHGNRFTIEPGGATTYASYTCCFLVYNITVAMAMELWIILSTMVSVLVGNYHGPTKGLEACLSINKRLVASPLCGFLPPVTIRLCEISITTCSIEVAMRTLLIEGVDKHFNHPRPKKHCLTLAACYQWAQFILKIV